LRKLAGAGWVTALNVDTLKAPDIAALAADGGPLPLFDEQNLAEITHPDCWYAPATPGLLNPGPGRIPSVQAGGIVGKDRGGPGGAIVKINRLLIRPSRHSNPAGGSRLSSLVAVL
jgi:hypothetical protein